MRFRRYENQPEELKSAHIFPERSGFQIPLYMRPEISVHPALQFQNSRKQNAYVRPPLFTALAEAEYSTLSLLLCKTVQQNPYPQGRQLLFLIQ